MALCSKQCYLIFFVIVVTSALDVSEFNMDTALNPRLVGAVYHLYNKPTTPTKVQPIVIDCNHPSIICKFGTSSMLVTQDKECNCKESTSGVPIISGLNTQEDKDTIKVTEKAGIVEESSKKETEVPIYKGVVDTNAILNEGERPYNVWNFQRNSMDKGWRPSQDPSKTRMGELPAKYYSYYPYTPTKLPNFSEDSDNGFPDFPVFPFDGPDDSRYVLWRKPGHPHISNNNTPKPAAAVSVTTKGAPTKNAHKTSTSRPASVSTPKKNVWTT